MTQSDMCIAETQMRATRRIWRLVLVRALKEMHYFLHPHVCGAPVTAQVGQRLLCPDQEAPPIPHLHELDSVASVRQPAMHQYNRQLCISTTASVAAVRQPALHQYDSQRWISSTARVASVRQPALHQYDSQHCISTTAIVASVRQPAALHQHDSQRCISTTASIAAVQQPA
jgi:hypothetical protein